MVVRGKGQNWFKTFWLIMYFSSPVAETMETSSFMPSFIHPVNQSINQAIIFTAFSFIF